MNAMQALHPDDTLAPDAAAEKPRLRADVSVHPYTRTQRPNAQSHVIRGSASGNYVITSVLGIKIVDCLDGTRDLDAIAAHLRQLCNTNVPRERIAEFLDICAANDFLEADSWGHGRRILVPGEARRERLGLYSKVYNADALLDLVLEYRRWWLNPLTRALAYVLMMAGVLGLFFIPEGGGLVAPVKQLDMSLTDVFLLLLPFVFVIEIALHELGHALACRLMGARPRGFGFGLLWGFMPIVFTDTTDAYTIADRRKRMFVSFAGPMVDLMIFGLLMLIWWLYQPTGLSAKLLLAYSAFPLTSVVVSLNPFFIRMDGYWILADFLDQPNLRRASMRYFKSLWRREGPPATVGAAPWDVSRRGIYLVYIVTATLWTSLYLSYVFYETSVTLIRLIHDFYAKSIFM